MKQTGKNGRRFTVSRSPENAVSQFEPSASLAVDSEPLSPQANALERNVFREASARREDTSLYMMPVPGLFAPRAHESVHDLAVSVNLPVGIPH